MPPGPAAGDTYDDGAASVAKPMSSPSKKMSSTAKPSGTPSALLLLGLEGAQEEVGDEQKLEYDPMEEIEVDDDDNPRSRGVGYIDPNSKRARYQKNKAKNRLLTVTVPAVAPEQDPMSTSTRTIQLYVVDRKQVWLDIDDVEWALRFLYMQFALKGVGVPVVYPDDSGPLFTPQKRKANDPW